MKSNLERLEGHVNKCDFFYKAVNVLTVMSTSHALWVSIIHFEAMKLAEIFKFLVLQSWHL